MFLSLTERTLNIKGVVFEINGFKKCSYTEMDPPSPYKFTKKFYVSLEFKIEPLSQPLL